MRAAKSLSIVAMNPSVRIVRLSDSGDDRGSSFQTPPECLELLGEVRDMHVATIKPGAVRGNHYHEQRREAIVLFHSDKWSLHWDSGPGTDVHAQVFEGAGAVLVEVEPGASHAVRNDGQIELRMVGLSSMAYDPKQPDSFRRQIV